MSDTLRDQLLGLGFKQAPKPAKPPRDGKQKPGSQSRTPAHGKAKKPHPRNTGKREDIGRGKAYAVRAQREKDERIAAERLKQEQARQRREAKAERAALRKDKALNDANADRVRHFDYGGKIKRIHVNAGQLKALNAGELGVVQLDGRYLLVTAAVLAEAEATFAPAVALKVDPDTPAEDDAYADSRF